MQKEIYEDFLLFKNETRTRLNIIEQKFRFFSHYFFVFVFISITLFSMLFYISEVNNERAELLLKNVDSVNSRLIEMQKSQSRSENMYIDAIVDIKDFIKNRGE